MANSIVQFLDEKKRVIDKIVDETFFRLMEPDTEIDPYMPITNYDDIDLLVLRFQDFPVIASIIGIEQEIPNRKSQAQLVEQQLGKLLIGISYLYKAGDFELMKKLQDRLAQGNQNAQMYVDYFFKKAAGLVPSLIGTATYLQLKVYTTGGCIYTDPLTGVQVSLTYPSIQSTLFPTALSGNNRWNQPTTANGFNDLYSVSRAYYDILGYYPDATLMSTKNFRELQSQNSTKLAAITERTGGTASVAGTDTAGLAAVYVGMDEINAILQRRDIPPIVLYDRVFRQENADGTQTQTRFLADDYVTFLSARMGERAMIPTAEKDFQPGIFTLNEIVSKAPRRERSLAMAGFVPFVPDARKLSAIKVN